MVNVNESMGPSHKEVGTKTPRCALLKALKKKKCFTDRTLLRKRGRERDCSLGSNTCPQGNRLGKISKPENEARKQLANGNESMGPSHKEVGIKTP